MGFVCRAWLTYSSPMGLFVRLSLRASQNRGSDDDDEDDEDDDDDDDDDDRILAHFPEI